ncbi:DUF3558 domain-containing protein [Nocardia sp. CDC159]|uniref:DUF3558 domain-containing protein n=1 Tax=Nocardia pulmonis TaxID=2951408 RepID=A0A9X2J2F1_9NOCA|nr:MULTISPECIES: DUF3558 domain-containing protein [Nocardia]MCM6777971.1 DUF3558 domain-containing protein [Nocardia pulmonis]MCM6790858.1 DUF3558 domain-containing protein [Nocardia sp. CDC159]
MKRSRYRWCLPLLLTAAFTAACSSNQGNDPGPTTGSSEPSTPSTSAAQSRPTLTAPSLQPPTQPSRFITSRRPQVVFDPCTWIPEDAIAKAGYDPQSRTRGGDQIAEDTFLICNFSSKQRTLSVLSGNVSWEEDLKKNSSWSEPITINGREAMWVRDPGLPIGCDIHLRTKAGFVDVGVTLTLSGRGELAKPCDGLLETATAIEPSIGKDN